MNRKVSTSNALAIILVSIVSSILLNSRITTSKLTKHGIFGIGIVEKTTFPIKGPPVLHYHYFIKEVKYSGSNDIYIKDKHHFLPGDSIIIRYLLDEKPSIIAKDKKRNVILFRNKEQIDSLNATL